LPQIVFAEDGVGVRGERGRERLDVRGVDREACGCAMPAEALEVGGARAERRMQVERGHGPA